MYVLITYDVETVSVDGQKRLRQVAKACVNHGQRVQNSVFECMLETADLTKLKLKLSSIINHEKDNIRFYLFGKNWKRQIEMLGKQTSFNFIGELIV